MRIDVACFYLGRGRLGCLQAYILAKAKVKFRVGQKDYKRFN